MGGRANGWIGRVAPRALHFSPVSSPSYLLWTMSQRSKPDFTFKVLGPPQVEKANGSPVGRLSPSSAALLAYLSLQRKPVARDHLASLFWPRAETSKARHSLRQLLSRIRARLPGLIVASGEQAGVDRSMIEVDVHQFEREIRERRIQSALGLWRGHFMEGWTWPESWELEDWIERERTRLDRLLEAAVAEAAEGLLAANRSGDSSKLLSQAISALPNSEGLILLQARALAASGYRPEAESVLVGADLDEEGQGFQDTLEEIRNGNGTQVPAPPEPEVPVPPEPEVPEGADGLGDSPDEPHTTGELTPEKTAAAPHRSWFRRNGVWVSLFAAAMAVVAFLGFDGEGGSPPVVGLHVPPVEIWFCSHREEEYAFRMDENGDNKFSLTREPGCPVIPVNGGEKAITFRSFADGAYVGQLIDGHFQPIAGPFLGMGSSWPKRQAGPLDGNISPDGRTMVVALELQPDGLDTSALPRFPDGIGNFDPHSVLDLFLVDLEDGSRRRLTHDAARDYEPRFLPDGSGVLWGSQRDGPGDLYFMELESGEIDRLTFGTLPARDPSVQGMWVAYHRGWGDGAEEGDQDLFLLDLATRTERRLTENDWNDTGPELSHDGRMICWTAKTEGHWEAEIMAMDLETGDIWHVSDMPGREDYCQWHPSAPVVFFQVWGTGKQEIYRSGWGARGPAVNLSRHVNDDHAPVVMGVG